MRVKEIIRKKIVGGTASAEVGTVAWTDETIKEADQYFDLVGISDKIVGQDYVDHIFDMLIALEYKDATYDDAERYYRAWLGEIGKGKKGMAI